VKRIEGDRCRTEMLCLAVEEGEGDRSRVLQGRSSERRASEVVVEGWRG
jgi:hypothetical protein